MSRTARPVASSPRSQSPRFSSAISAKVAAVTLVGLLATGCSATQEAAQDAAQKAGEAAESAAETAVEKSAKEVARGAGADVDDVELDAEKGTMTLSGPEGDLLVGEDLPLPDGFPQVLPLPASEHSVTAVLANEGRYEVTVLLDDPAELDAAVEEIAAGMTAANLEVQRTTVTEGGEDQPLLTAPVMEPGDGNAPFLAQIRFSRPRETGVVQYSVTPAS